MLPVALIEYLSRPTSPIFTRSIRSVVPAPPGREVALPIVRVPLSEYRSFPVPVLWAVLEAVQVWSAYRWYVPALSRCHVSLPVSLSVSVEVEGCEPEVGRLETHPKIGRASCRERV